VLDSDFLKDVTVVGVLTMTKYLISRCQGSI